MPFLVCTNSYVILQGIPHGTSILGHGHVLDKTSFKKQLRQRPPFVRCLELLGALRAHNGPRTPILFPMFIGEGLRQTGSHLERIRNVVDDIEDITRVRYMGPGPIQALAIGGKVMTQGQHFAHFNVNKHLPHSYYTHIGIIRHIPPPYLENLQRTSRPYYDIFKSEQLNNLKEANHASGQVSTSTIDCLLINSRFGDIYVSKWGEDGNPKMTISECSPTYAGGSVDLLIDLSVGKLFLHQEPHPNDPHGELYRYKELATDLTGAYSWCVFCRPIHSEVPYIVDCKTFNQ